MLPTCPHGYLTATCPQCKATFHAFSTPVIVDEEGVETPVVDGSAIFDKAMSRIQSTSIREGISSGAITRR